MRRAAILLVLSAVVAFLVVRGTTTSVVGHASAAPAPSNSSVIGPFAYSFSSHDPQTGIEGTGAGSMVFDGNGNVSGTWNQDFRCAATCGDQVVRDAPYTGTYLVHSDGSMTIDVCITLPTPFPTSEAVFEGGFSSKFGSFRFVMTGLAGPCGGPIQSPPHVTSGTGEKLFNGS